MIKIIKALPILFMFLILNICGIVCANTSDSSSVNTIAEAFVRGGPSYSDKVQTGTYLQVQNPADPNYVRHALLKFDISDLNIQDMESIRLLINVYGTPIIDVNQLPYIKAYGCTSEWEESTVTYATVGELNENDFIGEGQLRQRFNFYIDISDYIREQKAAGKNIVSIRLVTNSDKLINLYKKDDARKNIIIANRNKNNNVTVEAVRKDSGMSSITTVKGGGTYNIGDTVTIEAAVKPGENYVFENWENSRNPDNNKIYSPVYSFKLDESVEIITYRAVFKPLAQYTVTTGTNNDTLGSVSISPQQASYNYGTQVTLTATANPGSEFIGWEKSGKPVAEATSNTYTFNVEGSYNIKAIFAQQDPVKNKVTFKDADGRILKIDLVEDGGSAAAPADPSKAGYEFDKWDKPLSNITDNTEIYALYKKPAATYTVSVSNGTLSGSGGTNTNCQFDTQVTVIANTALVGQKFSHWIKNGNIVSYNTSYSFYVSENTTLAAVYAPNDAVIKQLPCITIDSNPIAQNGEISFIAQCTVDGVSYTEANIVEYGVVLSQSNNPDLGTPGIIRGKAGSKTAGTGQFMITKTNVSSGQTWYGRAYMIYSDSSGNLITVYSNTVNAGL